MQVYKIRSGKTGLFSCGGRWPRFSKAGKLWKRKGDLTSHLNQLDASGRELYNHNQVEIQVFEVKEEIASIHTYAEWMQAVTDRRQQREDEARKRSEAYRKQRDLDELERLRKLYPNS